MDTHLLAVGHARACGQRLPQAAAQLAVVVPRAGLFTERALFAVRVLPAQSGDVPAQLRVLPEQPRILPEQPRVAVAGARLMEDSGG